jgi:hypothetical protein
MWHELLQLRRRVYLMLLGFRFKTYMDGDVQVHEVKVPYWISKTSKWREREIQMNEEARKRGLIVREWTEEAGGELR